MPGQEHPEQILGHHLFATHLEGRLADEPELPEEAKNFSSSASENAIRNVHSRGAERQGQALD
jgi:hypothetical protein